MIPNITHLKEQIITATLDVLAPALQVGNNPRHQHEAIKEAIEVLQGYPAKYKSRRFAFVSATPDYCAVAACNLLRLAALQAAPSMCLFTVSELLGIALEILQKAKITA